MTQRNWFIQRIRVAEVEYTGQDLLRELERVTGKKSTVENRSTEEALAKGKEALARGDGRAAYVGYITKLNFDGSGATYFEAGLAWNSSGEYAVSSRSLKEIVNDAVA